jgi:two-component system, OmpR family, response regulator
LFGRIRRKENFVRILLVEDDNALAQGIATALRQNSYEVETVQDGRVADSLLSSPKEYDLLVLDLTLPSMDGSEVLRRLRERKKTTPVLVLTARTTIQDRVIGLDAGADDYVTKPFNLSELEARIRALLRRHNRESARASVEHEAVFDETQRILKIGNRRIDVSIREGEIARVLVEHIDKVVSREELLRGLSAGEEELGNNALEVYVHRLRRKLEGSGVELKTIRGLGYMLMRQT